MLVQTGGSQTRVPWKHGVPPVAWPRKEGGDHRKIRPLAPHAPRGLSSTLQPCTDAYIRARVETEAKPWFASAFRVTAESTGLPGRGGSDPLRGDSVVAAGRTAGRDGHTDLGTPMRGGARAERQKPPSCGPCRVGCVFFAVTARKRGGAPWDSQALAMPLYTHIGIKTGYSLGIAEPCSLFCVFLIIPALFLKTGNLVPDTETCRGTRPLRGRSKATAGALAVLLDSSPRPPLQRLPRTLPHLLRQGAARNSEASGRGPGRGVAPAVRHEGGKSEPCPHSAAWQHHGGRKRRPSRE